MKLNIITHSKICKPILTIKSLLCLGTLLLLQKGSMGRIIPDTLRNIAMDASDDNIFLDFLENLRNAVKEYISSEDLFPIDTLLFTPSNPKEGYNLQSTQESLNNSTFNGNLSTIFVIHGYSVRLPNSSVFFAIKSEILEVGDYNVIVVNWTRLNGFPYLKASVNGVIVALELSDLTQFLMENTGITAESIYVIGHSLGAQVAGFFGKSTPNIGRITGLDAAGPLFEILPPTMRLTYTDAIFVDAIHTNGAFLPTGGFGTIYPFADIDFFPNGGTQQPDCDINDTYQDTTNQTQTVNSVGDKISCNHNRAPYLFLESIDNSKCKFTSVLCDSYENFKKGNCPFNSSVTDEMGFHAKPIPSLPEKSKFYLTTSGEEPYCINVM